MSTELQAIRVQQGLVPANLEPIVILSIPGQPDLVLRAGEAVDVAMKMLDVATSSTALSDVARFLIERRGEDPAKLEQLVKEVGDMQVARLAKARAALAPPPPQRRRSDA